MKTPTLRFNTQDVMSLFGVSHMTVYQWRKGTARKTPLPAIEKRVGARLTVEFTEKTLRKWARENNVPFTIDPSQYEKKQGVGKPGPKTRSKATH